MLISYHMHQSNIPQGMYVTASKEECASAVTQPANYSGFVPHFEAHVENITVRSREVKLHPKGTWQQTLFFLYQPKSLNKSRLKSSKVC